MTYIGSLDMDNKEGECGNKGKGNLDKLRVIYDDLDDHGKGNVIRLGEGLLKSQEIMKDGKTGNVELKK
jgi:hypothetical protein